MSDKKPHIKPIYDDIYHQAITALDGVAAVNLSEPSEGDLERVVKQNRELRAENERLKLENDKLCAANEHLSRVDKRAIGEVLMENKKLKAQLKLIRETTKVRKGDWD